MRILSKEHLSHLLSKIHVFEDLSFFRHHIVRVIEKENRIFQKYFLDFIVRYFPFQWGVMNIFQNLTSQHENRSQRLHQLNDLFLTIAIDPEQHYNWLPNFDGRGAQQVWRLLKNFHALLFRDGEIILKKQLFLFEDLFEFRIYQIRTLAKYCLYLFLCYCECTFELKLLFIVYIN